MGVVVNFDDLANAGSPQLEDGHTRIANELLDKVILFDFSKRQYQVLLFIIRKTYGFHKKQDQISYSQIEAATGLDHSAAVKTVSELVSMNVVSKQHGQHSQVIGINKNYMSWVVVSKQHGGVKTTLLPVLKQHPQKKTPKENISSSAFEACWKEYPRKVGKGAAFKAWMKLKNDRDLFAEIYKAIKSQVSTSGTRLSAETNFIPHFSTWLNSQGWLDEVHVSAPVYNKNTNGAVL